MSSTSAAEPGHQFLKFMSVAGVGDVHVLPLGNQPEPVVAVEALATEDPLEGLPGLGVDDQLFVLVELHLERPLGVQHGNAGTAVIDQEIFVFPEQAFEHEPLDTRAGVLPQPDRLFVGGFDHHIEFISERLEQFQKGLKQIFGRDGRHERWNLAARLGVGVGVVPVARAGDDVELPAGPDRVGECEPPVAAAGQMGLEGGLVGLGRRFVPNGQGFEEGQRSPGCG